jgi:hypothetical protein
MSALDDLVKFRAVLVGVRRDAAANGIKPGADRAQFGIGLKNAQEWIEAIDHAIDDEKRMGGV